MAACRYGGRSTFVMDVKRPGFVQKSLDAMSEKARGVVVAPVHRSMVSDAGFRQDL
jgi:hypothetical protein